MRWEYFHIENNVLNGELFTKLTTFMTEIFKINIDEYHKLIIENKL